jgi:hypothetical protein
MKVKIFLSVGVGVLIFAGGGDSLRNVFGNRDEFVISGIVEADDIHVGFKVGGLVHKAAATRCQAVTAEVHARGEALVALLLCEMRR